MPTLIVYEYPQTLTFTVTDYCLGWTLSPASIILKNEGSVESFYEFDDADGMFINKYVLSPLTTFEFSYLSYTQYDVSKVDTGCGSLVYTFNYFNNRYVDTQFLYPDEKEFQ